MSQVFAPDSESFSAAAVASLAQEQREHQATAKISPTIQA